MVGHYQNWKRYNSAMITYFSNRLGDAALLLFFTYLIVSGTTGLLSGLMVTPVWGMLLVLAMMTKRAQWPLSPWLPEAISAPTPVSSLVHSSTLVTAGVLLVMKRPVIGLPLGLMLLLGCLTITIAGSMALLEKDYKKVVALSTLSQVAFLLCLVGLGYWWLSMFHLVVHAFFKRLLFFNVGVILTGALSMQDWRYYRNTSAVLPILLGMLCLLAIRGMLLLSGFITKEAVVYCYSRGTLGWCKYVLFIGALRLTLGYSLKMVSYCILCSNSSTSGRASGGLGSW